MALTDAKSVKSFSYLRDHRSTMAEESDFLATKRCAVVTGGNKGIGLEICRQLASNGVMVVLTARDEKRGIEAVEKLKDSGLSEYVVFHQLDVLDPSSISTLSDFIKTQYGKLDILVNNAGVIGVILDTDALRIAAVGWKQGKPVDWNEVTTQTYDKAEECLKTNYYAVKGIIETLVPLLQLSDSPRIVNVSSGSGQLKQVSNEWAKEVLGNVDDLTEERVDGVLNEFMKDLKEGMLEDKNWPRYLSAYTMAKAALNAYTRILAKKFPNFIINCVCPGSIKTDINGNTGIFTVEEGAAGPVKLALLPKGGPSGLYFSQTEVSSF